MQLACCEARFCQVAILQDLESIASIHDVCYEKSVSERAKHRLVGAGQHDIGLRTKEFSF